MNWLNNIARPEILQLEPYSSARSEKSDSKGIFLDANESPEVSYAQSHFEQALNRYPEPQPVILKQKLANIYAVSPEQLLITRGVDEGIELLIRAFCRPLKDRITITPPTFSYYEFSALINAVGIHKIPLRENLDFEPHWEKLKSIHQSTKILFLCRPNNPTGNLVPIERIKELCKVHTERILIAVDEAYIEFSNSTSSTQLLNECENLVVMRTLSKAYGLAGLRIGSLIGNPKIIKLLSKILPPYPIASPSLEIALKSLSPIGLIDTQKRIEDLIQEREYVFKMLKKQSQLEKVYESKANFIMVKAYDADHLFKQLKMKGILIRNRKKDFKGALRISIGSPLENRILLSALNLIDSSSTSSSSLGRISALPRRAKKMRKTKETEVLVEVILDEFNEFNQSDGVYKKEENISKGEEKLSINTGIGFFDHMLQQLARHSGMSLNIQAKGDKDVDSHHTIEDVAIVLGSAIREALRDKRGVNRFGFLLPLDEAEAKVSLDLSGRALCQFEAEFKTSHVGEFPTEMVKHFFISLSENMKATFHISVKGENTHHMIESIFKCFAKALGQAIRIDSDKVPSTKGVLE